MINIGAIEYFLTWIILKNNKHIYCFTTLFMKNILFIDI